MLLAPVICSTSAVMTERPVATSKTATLTFRIDPGLKEALRSAANQEHRSIANMVEMLIRGYCMEHGIAISNGDVKGKNGARS